MQTQSPHFCTDWFPHFLLAWISTKSWERISQAGKASGFPNKPWEIVSKISLGCRELSWGHAGGELNCPVSQQATYIYDETRPDCTAVDFSNCNQNIWFKIAAVENSSTQFKAIERNGFGIMIWKHKFHNAMIVAAPSSYRADTHPHMWIMVACNGLKSSARWHSFLHPPIYLLAHCSLEIFNQITMFTDQRRTRLYLKWIPILTACEM